MKIIVAGGGTGGHIIPNLALLKELEKKVPDLEVLYVGSWKGMEADMVPEAGYDFEGISCGKLRRYFSWENFLDIFRTIGGIFQSIGIINKFKPEIIFCKGGYVSFPVAIAGWICRKPVILHESDLELGLANRLSAKVAKKVCVSFPETISIWEKRKPKMAAKMIYTGNPVRPELRDGDSQKGWEFTGLKKGKKVMLVMGGSQGAQFINELIWHNLDQLLDKYQVVHVCGKGKISKDTLDKEGYFACEFIGPELKDVYAITDLIISRAGANSLAEIAYLQKPAILVPLVVGSRGDQVSNAEAFAKNNPVTVLDEKGIDYHQLDLLGRIDQLFKLPISEENSADADASARIVELLLSTASQDVTKKA